MSRRWLLVYALMVCLAAGSAIAFQQREAHAARSPFATTDNPGPAGAKALFTWLNEAGFRAGVLTADYVSLPPDAKVVVALGPSRRAIGGDEWEAIKTFVSRGGTYVYGVAREGHGQSLLREMELHWVFGPKGSPLLPESVDDGVRQLMGRGQRELDPSGADAIPWLPSPLLRGVRTLRVSTGDGLETAIPWSRPVAGADETPAVTEVPFEQGEVVLLAGTDLAANKRLGLGDNLQLWQNLAARGPVYFDDFHHRAREQQGRSLLAALGPSLAQLLLLGAAFVWASGRRFGVARALGESKRRSQAEYVAQLAQLYAGAKVDRALTEELYRSLRRTLFEKLGVSAALDDEAAARRLEQRAGIPAERYLNLVGAQRAALAAGVDGKRYAALARDFALLEQELAG